MEFENVIEVISRMLFQDLKDLASLGGSSGFRRTDPPIPKSRLVQKALLSRFLILLAMAVSCAVFPNHNPGDDVFKLELRLPPDRDNPCFCLQGQACDEEPDAASTTISTGCADTKAFTNRYLVVDAAYQFLLTPLTRWDASRFLELAIHPSARDPGNTLPEECSNNQRTSEACQAALFTSSEQAHAFFPMLPTVIRHIAKLLMTYLPASLLPSSYEGVVTLSALIWNTFCFVVAALALHDLTLGLTQKHFDMATADISNKKKKLPRNYFQQTSYKVFLLFCINPASVFFTAAYSEATFAMCNFVGHAILVRVVLASRKQQFTVISVLLKSLLLVLPLWMAASYTRSNGSISMAWLILQGLGWACHCIPQGRYIQAMAGLVVCVGMGMAVALPVYWHDAQGYHRHCDNLTANVIKPTWCSNNPSGFSLYGYVQQKHWNVGIFHYYTVKKIPNFVLAGPILLLSLLAVLDWIHTSRKRYASNNSGNNVIAWAFTSLATSVGWWNNGIEGGARSANNLALETNESLLLGPLMLGHYAVLAAVWIVGVLVAHVEITTRMICSSCPTIYWYMALCSVATKEADDKGAISFSMVRCLVRKLILPCCFLYITLGVVMHPNWLPWT